MIVLRGLKDVEVLKEKLEYVADVLQIKGGTEETLKTMLDASSKTDFTPSRKELIDRWLGRESWGEDYYKPGDFITIDRKTSTYRKIKKGELPIGIYLGEGGIYIYSKEKPKGEKVMARKKKAVESSPFVKGRPEIKKRGGKFVGVKEDDPLTFASLVSLEDLISADMHEYWDIKPAIFHPCIGRGCPGCEVGNEPRFKGYLPVLLKDGGVGVYAFTVSVYNQLESLEDELERDEGIRGYAIRVTRKGSGLSTRYTVIGLRKMLPVDDEEIPDFIPSLGPATEDDIWELLEENGYSRSGGVAEEAIEEADDWGEV